MTVSILEIMILLIQVILVIAKVLGYVTFSWWVVLLPLWILLTMYFIAFIIVLTLIIFAIKHL